MERPTADARDAHEAAAAGSYHSDPGGETSAQRPQGGHAAGAAAKGGGCAPKERVEKGQQGRL